ncbi:MAG: hypothetical protein Q8K46_05230, partial [Deltaproteobacteria bacterium]|nr:hypothetical protein [Deltaproteobacteria bacterium]
MADVVNESEITTLVDEWGEIESRISVDVKRQAAIEKTVKAFVKKRIAKKFVIAGEIAEVAKRQKLGSRVIDVGAFLVAS